MQNKSISSWLKTELAAHQWCSSVLNIYPSSVSPGIQIFVLLSLSSVHRWSRFLALLSEAKEVRQWSDTLAFRPHIDHMCPSWSTQSSKMFVFLPFTVFIHGWSTLWWLVSSSACTPSAETHCVCDLFPWPTSACSPPLRSLRLWLPFNGASAICQLQGQSCVAMGIFLTV